MFYENKKYMSCVVQIVGKKDTGKTLLIERLTSKLVKMGMQVGVIKSSHHEIDIRGKDSYRFKQAGAEIVVLSSPSEIIIFLNKRKTDIHKILSFLAVDVIFIEGFSEIQFGKRFEIGSINDISYLEDKIFKYIIEVCKRTKPRILVNGEIIEASNFYLYLYNI